MASSGLNIRAHANLRMPADTVHLFKIIARRQIIQSFNIEFYSSHQGPCYHNSSPDTLESLSPP